MSHSRVSSLVIAVMLGLGLGLSACGERPASEEDGARDDTITGFKTDLARAVEGGDPTASEALLDAARSGLAADSETIRAPGEIAFKTDEKAFCGSSASTDLGDAARQMAQSAAALTRAAGRCAPACPAMTCEAYEDTLIALERSRTLPGLMADRLAALSLIETSHERREREAWHGAMGAAMDEVIGTLLDTARQLTRTGPPAQAQTATARLAALQVRVERLATRTGDMMWSGRLTGPSANDLQADLFEIVTRLSQLRSLEALPPPVPLQAATVAGADIAETLALARWVRSTITAMDLPQAEPEPMASPCLAPLATALTEPVSAISETTDYVRGCAATLSCKTRVDAGVDLLAQVQTGLEDRAATVTNTASALATVTERMTAAQCP